MCCVGSGCGSPRLSRARRLYSLRYCRVSSLSFCGRSRSCDLPLRSSSLLGSCGSIDRDKIHAHTWFQRAAWFTVFTSQFRVCLSRLTSPRVTTGLRTAIRSTPYYYYHGIKGFVHRQYTRRRTRLHVRTDFASERYTARQKVRDTRPR